jgi:hypothetical protein
LDCLRRRSRRPHRIHFTRWVDTARTVAPCWMHTWSAASGRPWR